MHPTHFVLKISFVLELTNSKGFDEWDNLSIHSYFYIQIDVKEWVYAQIISFKLIHSIAGYLYNFRHKSNDCKHN